MEFFFHENTLWKYRYKYIHYIEERCKKEIYTQKRKKKLKIAIFMQSQLMKLFKK